MYTCEYCNKSFKREGTLATHMCPKKTRHMQENDPNVRIGYRAYQLFYKIGTNSKKPKSYSDFVDSSYYAAFIKFGSYCIDLGIDDPASYVEWLLRNSVKLDRWTKDAEFNKWIKERLKSETSDRAVERTIIFMNTWAEENEREWYEYFDVIHPNRAVFDICRGKISPWVLYSSEKAQTLIDRFNDEQIKMVVDYIDPDFWHRKMTVYKQDFKWVEDMLKGAGV
jgi:hypothetical protein